MEKAKYNLRKLIPKGILSSRKSLLRIAKVVDENMKKEREHGCEQEPKCKKIRKVTEASWNGTVKWVNSAGEK